MIYNPFTDTVFTLTWEDNSEETFTSYNDYQCRLNELEKWGYVKGKDFF